MSKGLEVLKKALNQAKQEAKEFSNPHFDDGHYLTKVVKAEVGQSKKGTDQIVVDFQFIEGEYAGKSKRTWMTLDDTNKQGLVMTVVQLEALGIDIVPETLEDDLRTLLGKVVRIKLVTTTSRKDGQEYQNIRIEKVVGVDPDAQDAAPVEDVAPEPEPEVETEEPEVEEAAEEEEPKPAKKSKKSKGSEEPEPEPEEEAESEEVEEEVAEEEDEDGVEIVKGMKVSFTKKDGSELTGKIDDIDEDNGKVVIVAKDADGKTKKFRVDVDRVSAL